MMSARGMALLVWGLGVRRGDEERKDKTGMRRAQKRVGRNAVERHRVSSVPSVTVELVE